MDERKKIAQTGAYNDWIMQEAYKGVNLFAARRLVGARRVRASKAARIKMQ
jgi:hypothetical protein